MTISRLKKPTLALALPALLAVVMLLPVPAQTTSQDQSVDAATTYKTKCVACHGPKADKRFDATLPEDQMVDTILKGKKAEKPPNMPAFGEKGITSDQAKALVAYMKSLKQ
jgi:mono/diheme cytochrome c family protein